MNEVHTIAIAGISGAGKSVQVKKIAELLENSTTLFFDEFKKNYNELTNTLKKLRNQSQHQHIIVEEPTGRRREGMEDLIDLLVFIDIPLEIALTRILLRAIYHSDDEAIDIFYQQIGPQFVVDLKETFKAPHN